jgi:hypothetical protein
MTYHGGLTPAALGCPHVSALQYVHLAANERCAPGAAGVSQPWCGERVGLRKAFAIARVIPNHGGLTPAALVSERSCIAQVAVSPANVRTAEPPRAGGVSPPWYASILIRQETLGAAGAIP